MMENYNICPNCFKHLNTGTGICNSCGFNLNNYKQKETTLPLFTNLNNGQYTLGIVLGQGGFGITYKAYDNFKNQIVAIKEYMPSEYSQRNGKTIYPITNSGKAEKIFEHGKSSYIEEIKTLYRFANVDGIVTIYSNFQENNTAYLVMEYIDGISLRGYMKKWGGKIPPQKAGSIICNVAESLRIVHNANTLHRDISPENILITNNGNSIKLIDFGAARHYIENSNMELSVLLKPGFAPPEQYSRTGNQSTWTDIYALASTLYYVVSGTYPPDSISRMRTDTLKPLKSLVPQITPKMSEVVSKAMMLDTKQRTQNCTQFINDLRSSGWAGNAMVPPNPILPHKTQHGYLCRISCVSGDKIGHYIQFFPNQSVVLGRNVDNLKYCDLEVSSEKFISKKHCVVEFDPKSNCFLVTDISQNGTFTNRGARLVKNYKQPISNGSILFLAKEEIIIQLNAFYK